MSKIYLNTTDIKESGRELVELSKEFNEIVNILFSQISTLDTANVWIGESANLFKQYADKEKIQYYNLKDNIYNYGKYLIDYANGMENAVSEVNKND